MPLQVYPVFRWQHCHTARAECSPVPLGAINLNFMQDISITFHNSALMKVSPL